MAIIYHAGRRVQGLERTGSTPTKEFNFSSSIGWVSGNTTYFYISSDKLNVKSDTDNIQTNMTYDLLANDSITVGTSWVMTFTLDIASPYAVNTNSGNQHRCYIGLASATTVGEPANIDEVDFTICPRSDVNAHESFNNNNTTAQYVGTGVTVTSGTKYIKLIRDGNTSFKTYIYNNADYSDTPTITEASNNLSNITGTKYIKVSQFVQNYSGTLNFTIDDLKFYNGVTSVVVPAGDVKPTNVQVGSRWEETDTRKMYHYNPSANITTDGSYTVLKFTETGTFTPTSAFNVEYLVVAGGGGGGSAYGGGGGAGGYLTGTGHGVTAQAYTITVGDGGAGNTANGQFGGDGGNSVFSSFTSVGGGGGSRDNFVGRNGGSGGGGGYYSKVGGTATSGQGYNGGTGAGGAPCYSGGGGGGASEVGQAGGNGAASDGGDGLVNDILVTGTNVYYAGGGGGQGGGATQSCSAGTGIGGNGGGGNSSSDGSTTPDTEDGTDGLGGGGGGTNNNATYNSGQITGVGGSGVVIIRFLTSGNTYTSSLVNTWSEEGT